MTTRKIKSTREAKGPGPGTGAAYRTLLGKVRKTLVEGQLRLDRERVRIYWETGRLIHAHVLKYERARRGQGTILLLAADLGVSDTVLHRCVKFVRKYPDQRKVATGPFFSWSHYRKLITVGDEAKRRRLEKGVAQKRWSVDELIVRTKEESRRREGAGGLTRSFSPADNRPLVPLRGELFTYQVVERPAVGGEPERLLDLGFGVFRGIPSRSSLSKGDFVGENFKKKNAGSKNLYTYRAVVEKVVDGDTLKVRLELGYDDSCRQVLRLRGIDCPELGTPEGEEARDFVRSLIKESSTITVRSSRSDKYDRYLADVFIPRGPQPDPATDIYLNNLLLETGRAVRAG